MDAVRAHLASCPDAHAEFEALGAVLPALDASVPVVEPPAALKDRLMAAAAADLATRAPFGHGGPSERRLKPQPIHVVRRRPAEREAQRAARRRGRRPGPGRCGSRPSSPSSCSAAGTCCSRASSTPRRRTEQSVAAVLDVAAAARVADGDPDRRGWRRPRRAGGRQRRRAEVTMAMRDLAPTTGDQVYEAWVIGGDGVPVPLGGFTVGATGTRRSRRAASRRNRGWCWP